MSDINSQVFAIEPAIDPNNRITFLLDWELTMKCNLDCDYCASGLHGGHDNSTQHPPLEDCVKAIDFMLEYADLYMAIKPAGIKYVVLNLYGGEALHHPHAVEILQLVKQKYQQYAQNWHLTITTTTNAIVTEKKLQNIIPLVDEFTVSYHTTNTEKQKETFKQNLLAIRDSGKRLKCIVMMHNKESFFEDAKSMIAWCEANNIRNLPKQIDYNVNIKNFNHQPQQVQWLEGVYNKKSFKTSVSIPDNAQSINLAETGRACCGGRQLCVDKNYRQRSFFVHNKFPDWYCSVNHFFLFVKQVNGEIYTNKDCKMNFEGEVEPIGNLSDAAKLLTYTRENLLNNTLPVIQCKKYKCLCGLCAPKARNLSDYREIMKKYIKK